MIPYVDRNFSVKDPVKDPNNKRLQFLIWKGVRLLYVKKKRN